MKIVFIPISTENIAVEYLASYLKKNDQEAEIVFDPHIFASEALQCAGLAKFFDTAQILVQQVLAKKPDVIGFSVFTVNYQRALTLARFIKKTKPDLPIIFGGVHPTCVPDKVIEEECVDIVCVGEGEEPLLELLDSFKNKEKKQDIKNLWFKDNNRIVKNPLRPLKKNLDEFPFPDKEIFYSCYAGFKKDYLALSSRGCPFACTFCANQVLHQIYQGLGTTVSRRSPENMIQELILAKKQFSPQKITFVDDVFIQDVAWLEEFIGEYKEKVNLPYVVLTHPIFINSLVTPLLKNSGCYLLMFGVQSASPETRRNILKRFESNEQIMAAAQACHQVKLNFSIDHIFNIPGEGALDNLVALEFYNQLRPAVVNAFWLQYFPRTEIIGTAQEYGIIKPADIDKIEQGLASTSVVVGLGGKDSFDADLKYANFQFWLMLLPLLPAWLMRRIIRQKKLIMAFKPPLIVNVMIKFMTNLMRGRGNVYGGIIKFLFYFMGRNLILKWRTRYAK